MNTCLPNSVGPGSSSNLIWFQSEPFPRKESFTKERSEPAWGSVTRQSSQGMLSFITQGLHVGHTSHWLKPPLWPPSLLLSITQQLLGSQHRVYKRGTQRLWKKKPVIKITWETPHTKAGNSRENTSHAGSGVAAWWGGTFLWATAPSCQFAFWPSHCRLLKLWVFPRGTTHFLTV